MPYKRNEIWLILCCLYATTVHSQVPQPVQLSTRLEVVVQSHIELQLNQQVAEVVFQKYRDSAQINNGLVQNQFVIVSNAPYSISVAAATPYLTNDVDRIPMSSVGLNIVGAGSQPWVQPVSALSTRPQLLSRMAPPTLSQPYSIMYRVRPLRQVTHAAAGNYHAGLMFLTTQE